MSTIGKIMEVGVQVGGTPYLPTSYRWGYGWPFLRGYKPLTADEEVVVREKQQNYEKALKDRCG